MSKPCFDAKRLVDAIQNHLGRTHWRVASEVPLPGVGRKDQAPTRAMRRIDAIAMSVSPNHGYELRGYEVKISRADLQSELRDPLKWEAAGCFVDKFYLVAGHESVYKGAVIPRAWGVLVWRDGDLLEVEAATNLRKTKRSRELVSRRAVSSFVDRLTHDPDQDEHRLASRLRDEYRKGREAGFNEGLRLGKKKGRSLALEEGGGLL